MSARLDSLKPYVDAMAAGEPMPEFARRELAFGTPEDVAGLVVYLASDDSAGVNGQAIGIGGDRLSLYSHPDQIVKEYAAGGWSADAIADVWPSRFAPSQQSVGETLPTPPSA